MQDVSQVALHIVDANTGSLKKSTTIGRTTANTNITKLVVAPDGNVLVFGSTSDSLVKPVTNSRDPYVQKFNSAGDVIITRQYDQEFGPTDAVTIGNITYIVAGEVWRTYLARLNANLDLLE